MTYDVCDVWTVCDQGEDCEEHENGVFFNATARTFLKYSDALIYMNNLNTYETEIQHSRLTIDAKDERLITMIKLAV